VRLVLFVNTFADGFRARRPRF